MAKFFCLAISLFTGLALCCVSLIAVERLQPPIEAYKPYGLEACNGHYCLHGIEPGKTRYSEAVEILKVLGRKNLRAMNTTLLPYYAPDKASTVLAWLDLENSAMDAPRVGDTIVGYGWPCAATIQVQADNNFTMWLEYPYLSVDVPLSLEPQFVRGGTLDADSSIDNLRIHDDPGTCQPRLPPTQDGAFTIPWLGFGSIQKYLDYYNANYTHLASVAAN